MKPHSVRGRLASAAAASFILCSPASAQWAIGVEVGADRYWGGSIEKTSQRRSFRPYRPTSLRLGLERKAGAVALAIKLGYSSAGLALEGPGGLTAVNGVFTVYGVSPEIGYHVASFATVNRLLLHAGPLLEVWSALDEESETRLGVQGGLSLSVPLGGRFAGTILAAAAWIPSPFAAGQLNQEFQRRALWRRRFGVGLEYRL